MRTKPVPIYSTGGTQLSRGQHRLDTELRTVLRADPSLVLRSKVLALSQFELEQAIENELNDNPALERIDGESETIEEAEILRQIAPQELRQVPEDFERVRCTSPDESKADWVDLAPSGSDLREHVLAQLLLAIPEGLHKIGSYLVHSLDERGFLTASPEEIALALNCSLPDVEAAIEALKRCEPRGVGASGIIEALTLQLSDLATFESRLAAQILEHDLDDLIARRTARLSRAYRVMPVVVENVYELILQLNPNPANGFGGGSSSLFLADRSVTPDLVLRRTENDWEIEPVGGDPSTLRVEATYRARLAQLRKSPHPDEAEFAHLSEFTNRAVQFIQSLKDRRRTLRQIGAYLIEKQGSFVSTGRYEFLQSLTRTKMARELGIHESTVSRATMGKYVQIANGDVVPFEVFFKPALRVQKMIEDLLEQENPAEPLSDSKIAEILAARGIHIARRTVNKYRERRKMLNSRGRRSA